MPPSQERAFDRRRFLRVAVAGSALLATGAGLILPRLFSAKAASGPAAQKPLDVPLEIFGDDGRDIGTRRVPLLVLSDEQWRQRLSPAALYVMRDNGTERPFSGDHEKPASRGIYRCAACATALYDAATEFDSGTGWPSFWKPIAKINIVQHRDDSLGMDRTAVGCAGCNSHLGHVFDDGPRPTGMRYCMNAVALHFVPLKQAE